MVIWYKTAVSFLIGRYDIALEAAEVAEPVMHYAYGFNGQAFIYYPYYLLTLLALLARGNGGEARVAKVRKLTAEFEHLTASMPCNLTCLLKLIQARTLEVCNARVIQCLRELAPCR